MEVNENQNCLVINFFQNIFLCVQEKKMGHTALERHEDE